MDEKIKILKNRVKLYLFNVILMVVIVINVLSNKLMPLILEYGEYQCETISTRLVNYLIETKLNSKFEEIVVSFDSKGMEFNTSILNSVASNLILSVQKYFYLLENGMLEESMLDILDINAENNKLKKGVNKC